MQYELEIIRDHLADRCTGGPVSQRLAAKLREMILAGRIPASSKLPSQGDLARMLGVGDHTIQSSLSQLKKEGLITRQPSAGTFVAAVPAEPKCSIGIIFEQSPMSLRSNTEWRYEDSNEWQYLRTLFGIACEAGCRLVLDGWKELDEQDIEQGKVFSREDGLLGILAFNLRKDQVGNLRRLGATRPGVVAVNARIEDPNVSYVCTGLHAAIRETVAKLRTLGHRRVCAFQGDRHSPSVNSEQIVQALRDILREAGLPPAVEVGDVANVVAAFDVQERPTVLWTAGHAAPLVPEVRAALKARRLETPADFCVVRHGHRWDETREASYWCIEERAVETVSMAAKIITDGYPAPTRVEIPARVVEPGDFSLASAPASRTEQSEGKEVRL